MSLVVTGAAGHLGRSVAELLFELVDPARLVLVTRRPDSLSDLAARGADVRYGDFDDPASLATAFAGGERMLLISTDAIGRRVQQHVNAIETARDAGVSHIAYTSIPNPTPENPALVVDDHRATEQVLFDSGMAWSSLRNALYSEYRVPEAEQALAAGVFRHNQGDGRSAYVSREDCAAAAAAVLTGGAEHDGRAYNITGPELLGGADLARLYAAAGGRDVTAESLDDATFAAGLTAAGLPADVVTLMTSFGAAVRVGALDQITGDVETLTGRAPETVATLLARGLGAAA